MSGNVSVPERRGVEDNQEDCGWMVDGSGHKRQQGSGSKNLPEGMKAALQSSVQHFYHCSFRHSSEKSIVNDWRH